MRIAILGRALRPGLTGIGRYSLNLIRSLAVAMAPERLTVLAPQEAIGLDGFNGIIRRARVPTGHELGRALWEQLFVPIDVRRDGIELLHSPGHSLPLALSCRSVITIHDLSFLDPRLHRYRNHLYFTALVGAALHRADHVIAVSHHTRQQLVDRFPHVRAKVTVIYQGLDPSFQEPPNNTAVCRFRQRHGLERPYVLFVGTIEPRKNLPGLIAAFKLAVERRDLSHDLVLCGPLGWLYGPVAEAIDRFPLPGRIRRLGYLPDQELPLCYAGADLFVYPSLWEGFGLPPLEAMACGTPVITSNTTALPEVVDDAAITVTPTDIPALAEAMLKVLDDKGLAEELRGRGRQRAGRFSYQTTATETLALYRQVLRS